MNAKPLHEKKLRLLLVVCVIALSLSTTNVLAATGALDPTFGSNGVVTTKYNGMPSSANEVALQTDGKIVVLGTVKINDSQSSKIITRYNNNGTVDTSFGTNGSTLIDVNLFSGSKIALQPDGKLVVGGLSGVEFAAVRYNSNGTLDTSFGTNGMGVVDWGYSEIYQTLADIAIQSDGKIFVVGDYTAGQSNYTDFVFARFNSNGTKDITNTVDFPNSRYNYGQAVVIQPDGKIVISGNMQDNDGKYQLSLARLNQDGSLDKSTFGTNGTVETQLSDFQISRGALALQSDGKIIVAGTTSIEINQNLTIVRYNSNGTLDATFGGTGIVTTDFGNNEQADDLVIQADGKIIVEGKTTNLDSSDFLLARYNSDGSLDTTFGTNGKVVTDFGNTNDIATGIAQQSDGKVVVVGTSGDNAILARYDTGTSNTTQTTLTFNSAGAYDGWILESGENTNKGGTLDKKSNLIYVGDDAKDRQYRGILSFNTDSIPDNATVTAGQVKIKRQSYVGTIPLKTHGAFQLEIRNGSFNNDVALTLEDFSALASTGSTQDVFSGLDTNAIHTATLSNTNLGLINKSGVTQFRISFSKDDNDDLDADYLKLFSGETTSPADQPQLIVTYSTTSGGGTGNHAPVINGGAAISISIPENTTIVTAVTAVDSDGQPITYSISGLDADKFSISPSTGLLTFVTAPDFEAIPSGTVYHLTAKASDGFLTATQDIAVTVTGVNEFAPVITSNGGGAVAYISLPENTLDVTTVTATDADLPTPSLKYWITGGADGSSGLFTINSSDGKISFVAAPSYNVPNDADSDHVYHIMVQASDGQLTDSQELVISITPPSPPPSGVMQDATFGSNGVTTTKINGLPTSTRDVVLQPDGKIITLGSVQAKKVITRYNNNGTLDTSFGTNGNTFIEVTPFSGSKIALQPNGKLIVAGLSNRGYAVVRYNGNGTLDTSFGTNGMGAIAASIDDENSVEDVTVQPDGKIVAVGSYHFNPGNHIDFQIVRFNSDGTRDAINTIDWGDFPASRYNWGKAVAQELHLTCPAQSRSLTRQIHLRHKWKRDRNSQARLLPEQQRRPCTPARWQDHRGREYL
jgi:uncharacterized delta-60 repeat protein